MLFSAHLPHKEETDLLVSACQEGITVSLTQRKHCRAFLPLRIRNWLLQGGSKVSMKHYQPSFPSHPGHKGVKWDNPRNQWTLMQIYKPGQAQKQWPPVGTSAARHNRNKGAYFFAVSHSRAKAHRGQSSSVQQKQAVDSTNPDPNRSSTRGKGNELVMTKNCPHKGGLTFKYKSFTLELYLCSGSSTTKAQSWHMLPTASIVILPLISPCSGSSKIWMSRENIQIYLVPSTPKQEGWSRASNLNPNTKEIPVGTTCSESSWQRTAEL